MRQAHTPSCKSSVTRGHPGALVIMLLLSLSCVVRGSALLVEEYLPAVSARQDWRISRSVKTLSRLTRE